MTTQEYTFAEHLLDTNHKYKHTNENFTILDFENEQNRRITHNIESKKTSHQVKLPAN